MRFFFSRMLSLPDDSGGMAYPPVFFSCLPTLETRDLVLRRLRRKDAEDIYSYASDPKVARYVLWDPHRSPAETRRIVRDLCRRAAAGWPSSWAVTLRETGRVIGTVGFVWYSSENRSAEIGYSFARDCWNRGYATQAVRAVAAEAFRSLPLNRLEAQHDVRNPASGRVLEKCGFRREGVLRGRILNKGEYADVMLWSLLRTDAESGG